jgi:hypothetical protein
VYVGVEAVLTRGTVQSGGQEGSKQAKLKKYVPPSLAQDPS